MIFYLTFRLTLFATVLQLCYNQFSGGVPTQLGSLKKLSVLALQYNNLTGVIPASLGELGVLTRLDLSFNNLFGPIPVRLANAQMLQVLDLRNNTFTGNVPSGNLSVKIVAFVHALKYAFFLAKFQYIRLKPWASQLLQIAGRGMVPHPRFFLFLASFNATWIS